MSLLLIEIAFEADIMLLAHLTLIALLMLNVLKTFNAIGGSIRIFLLNLGKLSFQPKVIFYGN